MREQVGKVIIDVRRRFCLGQHLLGRSIRWGSGRTNLGYVMYFQRRSLQSLPASEHSCFAHLTSLSDILIIASKPLVPAATPYLSPSHQEPVARSILSILKIPICRYALQSKEWKLWGVTQEFTCGTLNEIVRHLSQKTKYQLFILTCKRSLWIRHVIDKRVNGQEDVTYKSQL